MLDIIIFGHLHDPFHEEINLNITKTNKIQYILSPGSFTQNRYVNYNSYMTMELSEGNKPKIELKKIT